MGKTWTDSYCNHLVLQQLNIKKAMHLCEFVYKIQDEQNGTAFGHYELEIKKGIERLLNCNWPLVKSMDHPDHPVLSHV